MLSHNIELINDGQSVSREFVNEWDIQDYCVQYKGNFTISFVGVILKKENVLFSLPKHYNLLDNKAAQFVYIKKIIQILSKGKATSGSFDKGLKGEFPIKSYLGILNYYKKHGFYFFLPQMERILFYYFVKFY